MSSNNKVVIRGIKSAQDNLLKAISKAVTEPNILDEIGKVAVSEIKSRTRGRQLDYIQPELKESTKNTRERLIRAGNAFSSRIVRKGQSNLSMSGQLLDALYHRISRTRGIISILIRSPRQAYRGIRKATLENLKNNNQIKDDLETLGFKFFFISKKLQTNLEARLARALRRSLSLFNKTKRKLVK